MAAPVWWKVGWMRPSRSAMSSGSGRRYVLRSFVSSRHSSTTGTSGWSSRIARSTRASVEYPVLPLRPDVSSELLEEDPRELLGRAELELLARVLVRLRLELLDALGEARSDLTHAVGVDPDPGVLHVGEHRGERQLDLVVELLGAPLAHARAEQRREAANGLRAPDEGGGLLLGRGHRHELEAVLAREVVELVAGAAGIDEVGGDQRVVGRTPGRGAAASRRARRASSGLRRGEGRPATASTDDDLVPGRRRRAVRPRTPARGRACVRVNTSSSTRPPARRSPRSRGSARRQQAAPRRACRRGRGGRGTRSAGRSPSASSGRAVPRRARTDRRRAAGRAASSRAASSRAPARRAPRTAFPRAGESSSACSITASSEPYCATSWPAVLSPIPGIPGTLSEVSPLSPMKSGTCSGLIP